MNRRSISARTLPVSARRRISGFPRQAPTTNRLRRHSVIVLVVSLIVVSSAGRAASRLTGPDLATPFARQSLATVVSLVGFVGSGGPQTREPQQAPPVPRQAPPEAEPAPSAPPTTDQSEEVRQEFERQRLDELEELERQRSELDQQLVHRRAEIEAERAQAAEDERIRGEDSQQSPESRDWRREARRKRGADQKFGFGSSVKVRAGEVADDVISIAGGAKIDGEVLGDVTTFGGAAKINGYVSGSVTAIGGNVELGPRAVVDGDVSSLGGEVLLEPTSEVGGEISDSEAVDFDFGNLDLLRRGHRTRQVFGFADWVEFFWALMFTGFLVVLCGFLYLVFQRPVERVRDVAFDSPLKSFLIGLLTVVLSIPALVAVIIVLAISIIGIPFLIILVLLLPFALIALMIAVVYGYTAIAVGVGSVLRSHLRLSMTSGLALLLVGIVALRALTLSGDLLDAIGLPAFVTVLFAFAGFVIQAAAGMTGLGAVFLSRFGLASAIPAYRPPTVLPPVPTFGDDEPWRDEPNFDPIDERAPDDPETPSDDWDSPR